MHLYQEAEANGVLPVALYDADMNYYSTQKEVVGSQDAIYWPEEGENGSGGFDLGNNMPSFGLVTVVVKEFKIPAYWNWGWSNISDSELKVLLFASDVDVGGGGRSTPCPLGGVQNVDFTFLEAREGNSLTGYVPTNNGAPIGKSGVTIGAGFDLGQHNLNDLNSMNLSQSLVDKFSPYLGMKGQTATSFLSSHPLSITSAEVSELNPILWTKKLSKLVVEYDKATGQDGSFYALSGKIQTVIADVSFQYGNLSVATPNFWQQVTHGDWDGALNNLRNFGDSYPTRRNLEADLLASALKNGELYTGICQ
jgi:hypothetical protein